MYPCGSLACLSPPGSEHLVLPPRPRREGLVLLFLPPLLLLLPQLSLPLLPLPPPSRAGRALPVVGASTAVVGGTVPRAGAGLPGDPFFPVPLARCPAALLLLLRCCRGVVAGVFGVDKNLTKKPVLEGLRRCLVLITTNQAFQIGEVLLSPLPSMTPPNWCRFCRRANGNRDRNTGAPTPDL